MTALAVVYAGAGYYAVGLSVEASRSTELWTALDRAFPFLPWTIHPYGLVYTAALFPAFCVADRRFFRRVVLAYVFVLTASFAIFALFPVTSLNLRVPAEAIDTRVFDGWAMRVVYFLDPPFNLFPSLHLGLALVATISAFVVHRGYGLAAAAGALAITASIFTTRQHFVADALAAALLAIVGCTLAFRGRLPDRAEGPVAFSWRGPVAYLGFHAGFYATFITLYLAGWEPWAKATTAAAGP